MRSKCKDYVPLPRGFLAILALAALAVTTAPGTAAASTTAGASIVNIVQVDYQDATASGTVYHAAYSTTVTVNRVLAPLSITATPNSATMPGFSCKPTGSYATNSTFTAYYALTANTNGQDTYNLALSQTPTNGTTTSATYALLKADGTTLAAATSAASTRTLNSAIVVGVQGSNILEFPGGSLKNVASGGFDVGDIAVVDYGAGVKTAYLVTAVNLGRAKSYSITTGAPASSTTGSLTTENRDTITLGPWVNNSLGIGNGGTSPAFGTTAPAVGTVLGQMVLAKIDVQVKTTAIGAGNDAYSDYQLDTTDSASGNHAYVGTGGGNTCKAGDFITTKLTIIKSVANLTPHVPALAAGTSMPGDILEYTVVVNNPGGQAAASAVSDNIPPYTTLVTFSDNYNGTATYNTNAGVFANISDGINNLDLTVDGAGEVAAQPAATAPNVGFGKAAGVTANSLLNFYLGHGSNLTTGGTVPSCSDSTKNTLALCTGGPTWRNTYTIKYRVKVD